MKPEALLGFPVVRIHDLAFELQSLSEREGPIQVTGEIDGKKIDYLILTENNMDVIRGTYAGEPIEIKENGAWFAAAGSGIPVKLEMKDSRFQDAGKDFKGEVSGI